MKSICAVILVAFTVLPLDAQELRVRQVSEQFEAAVLKWVQVEGTPGEKDAYDVMLESRKDLASLGPRGIDEIVLLVEHRHENVRRGSAIALLSVVEDHKLDSQILLDKVLLRMVEDPDLKTRHNLYHVSRKLIANIRRSDRISEETADKSGSTISR